MITEVNGIRLVYDDIGQGVPILWVHGYPLTRALWAPQAAGLAGVARSLVPDLRGFGESDAPAGVYTMETYAADLAALLQQADVDRVVLAGLSMGGYIALAFARLYPDRLRALVLADTRAGPDSAEAAQKRRSSAERALREGVAPVVGPLVEQMLSPVTRRDQPALAEAVRAMVLAARPDGAAGALLGMAERRDAMPDLRAIAVPALVIVGADDGITPPAESQAMAAALPRARLVVIPNAGHLSNLERPDEFNREVRAFLGTLES